MTGSRKTQVPAIPAVTDPTNAPALRRALDAQKEALEVAYGRRGDPLDRFVTLREMGESGIARVKGGRMLGPGITGGTGEPGAPLFDPGDPDFGDDDLTAPPAPTGVVARGVGPDSVMVTWDTPNYRNHAYAEVFYLLERLDGGPNTFDFMIGLTPTFQRNQRVNANNAHTSFAGAADGTLFMHRDLARVERVGQNALDAALNPTVRYYWVRFVSTAGVPGPFHTTGEGARGAMTIDPTRVLDAMVDNVTASPIYSRLRQLIGLPITDPNIIAQGGIVQFFKNKDDVRRQSIESLEAEIGDTSWLGINETLSSITRNADDSLDNLWSVRMNQTIGNTTIAAGFGLGLRTNSQGQSVSTFAVSANQFAVMGPTTPFVRLKSFTRNPSDLNKASISWDGALPFSVAQYMVGQLPKMTLALSCMTEEQDGSETPLKQLHGVEFQILSFSGGSMSIQRDGGGTFPIAAVTSIQATRYGFSFLGPYSIPFIIDTARNVVGIRGSLIVDGLVRSQVGDFNTLIADTAFMRHIRADIVNANLVIGNRLTAGASEGEFSNWRVELNSPTAFFEDAGQNYPMRYWRPATGQVGFYLDRNGNVGIGGNLSVGQNAVIATSTQNGAVFSIGGDGADGTYLLWCGPRAAYGSNGSGRSEANGILWIKQPIEFSGVTFSSTRAGFNADLFLGQNAFALPTMAATNQAGAQPFEDGSNGLRAGTLVTSAVSSSSLTIRALRSGAAALTLVTVSGYLARTPPGNGDNKRFVISCTLVGSSSASTGIQIQSVELDDYDPETYPFSLSGVVEAPAGTYHVRIDVENKGGNGQMSIIRGWNAVAMQITTNAGLL